MSEPVAATPPAVEMRGIAKRFGAVQANRDVDLVVGKATIHGLIGENGAGKSTLMSILHGFHVADEGSIRIDGVAARITSSRDAIGLGIEMVHQHFMLVEDFTVLENVMLGAEGSTWLGPAGQRARAAIAEYGSRFGLVVDPDARIADLAVGLQQRVEILKALYRGARILILDEPTAVLTPPEADDLFRILRRLREQGTTILLVTHKLREILAVTSTVSVMRQGRMVASRATVETSAAELSALMIGRSQAVAASRLKQDTGATLLEVAGLEVRDRFGVARVLDASFVLRAGEVLGIAGVAGNGQSELLEALAGMRRPHAGSIRLKGNEVFPGDRFDAASQRSRGLAHVPEDRLRSGLVPAFPAEDCAILGYQEDQSFRMGFLLDRSRIFAHATRLMDRFDVRPPDPRLRAGLFSGGNQQKLILAREIDRDPDVLLVGQPTRGVDIGGIEVIHERLLACRAAGKAVLLVSVELDEVRRLSDRILVMSGGRIVGEVASEEADEGRLGLLMSGMGADERAPSA